MNQLTRSLTVNVKILTDYLTSVGHPLPSFAPDTPTFTLPGNASSEAHLARYRILDLARNLFHLAAGPSEYLTFLQTSVWYPQLDGSDQY
jgi:6-hydroxytryprostatin B O-methyltransferase